MKNTKKPLKYKVSKIKHTTHEDKKNRQVHSQIKIHFKNINEIEKYKILIMTEHKTDTNITTYKKLITTEHKTDMNNIKIEKYKKPEVQSIDE